MGQTEGIILQYGVLAMSRLKPWNTNGSISSSSFHVQLVDCYYSRILALSNQWMKFSFNEMRMWGQSKISSCCICDWCKSSEKGGRGSQAMQHNFVLRTPYPLPKIAAISHKAKITLSMQKKRQQNHNQSNHKGTQNTRTNSSTRQTGL